MSPLSSSQSKLTGFKIFHNIYQKFQWLVIKAVLALLWLMRCDKTVLMCHLSAAACLIMLSWAPGGLSCRESYSLLNSKCEIEIKLNKYFMVCVSIYSSKPSRTLKFYTNSIFYNKIVCYHYRKKFKMHKREKLPSIHCPEIITSNIIFVYLGPEILLYIQK